MVIWMTGLSGAGKTTLAVALKKAMCIMGIKCKVLDGDQLRQGISNGLTFTKEDRSENIRRIAEVAKLFAEEQIIPIVSVICPFEADRIMAENILDSNEFILLYVKCSIMTCKARDPKGWYKKTEQNTVENFTGITSPFEEPLCPDLIVDTEWCSLEDSIAYILREITPRLN